MALILPQSKYQTSPNPNNFVPEIASFETKVDWFATLRPRFGWLLNEQTLPYVTGGLAIGRIHASYTWTSLNSLGGGPSPDTSYPSSTTNTSIGWSLSGGVEYAVSQRWTLKAEYLHVDLGKMKLRSTVYDNPRDWQDISVRTTLDLVRAGVNYRF